MFPNKDSGGGKMKKSGDRNISVTLHMQQQLEVSIYGRPEVGLDLDEADWVMYYTVWLD